MWKNSYTPWYIRVSRNCEIIHRKCEKLFKMKKGQKLRERLLIKLDFMRFSLYNQEQCLLILRRSNEVNFVNTFIIRYIRHKGGVRIWRWHFSRRRDQDLKFTDSEQEWAHQAEEKFWQQEEQKEENSYQHRPHICGLFFYLILNDNRIFVIWNEEDIDEIFWVFKKE